MSIPYHIDNIFFDKPLNIGIINILQIGRLYCEDSTVIDTHVHTNYYEVTVVKDGRGVITTNNLSSTVEKGDIYLSLPCDTHKIIPDKNDPLKYDFTAFTLNDCEFKKELDVITQNYHSSNLRIIHDDLIPPLLANSICEIYDKDIFSTEIIESLYKQMIIYIIRKFRNNSSRVHNDNASNSEILCYKIMNYIDTHIYSLKNLNDLSNISDYSYEYLSFLFKKTTGNTLREYFNKKRLNTAKLLLNEDKLSITKISELLNYSTVYSFSKAFTALYGCSPRNYKNKNIPNQ